MEVSGVAGGVTRNFEQTDTFGRKLFGYYIYTDWFGTYADRFGHCSILDFRPPGSIDEIPDEQSSPYGFKGQAPILKRQYPGALRTTHTPLREKYFGQVKDSIAKIVPNIAISLSDGAKIVPPFA